MELELNINPTIKEVTFIYFKGATDDSYDFILSTFNAYFEAQDTIQIDTDTGAFVLSEIPEHFDDSLDELMEMVYYDFGLRLQFLIGNKHPVNKDIDNLFKSEKQYLPFLNEKIQTITQIYIIHSLAQSIEPEKVFIDLHKRIKEDDDLSMMIQKLWTTGNNIAQAASELYLHRNTLIYRMNKFQKDTQLDLKNQNDLLISYLLTLR